MDDAQLRNAVREILTHESVSRDAGISKEVQSSYNALASSGEQCVRHIASALNGCARGQFSSRWWYGAEELCKLLSRLNSASAREALLTILKTDSNIAEYDRVRYKAVELIASFNDPSVIPVLLEASRVPHSPILAINKAIEALGGIPPVTPETIILEGKRITDDVAAIQHFAKYAAQVPGWTSKELQGAFYWWYGNRLEKSQGIQSALPLYAAAVLADHDSEAPAWRKFRGISPSAQSARKLAEQYPLSSAPGKDRSTRDGLTEKDRERQETDMFTAAKKGDTGAMAEHIRSGADVNAREKGRGMTALMMASYYGHADIVKALIDSKATVNAKEKERGWGALMFAVQNGHGDVVKLLIDAGADINASHDGITALMRAALDNHADIAKILIDAGADVDAKGFHDRTALIHAAQKGHANVVRLLIDSKADLNAKASDSGWTALMTATSGKYADVVRLLIDAKANISEKGNNGVTALSLASRLRCTDIMEMLKAGDAKNVWWKFW
jgi:ankyrin repeat protein